MFAIITPGRPLITNFIQTDEKHFLLNSLPLPTDQFALSLLTSEIPPNHGFSIYWSIIPFSNWEYLGSLTLDNPTAFFTSPWNTTNSLELIDQNIKPQGIQIGISLETLDFINNIKSAEVKLPERSVGVDAMGIAQHLFNYIASIDNPPPGFIQVVTAWLKKFEAKLKYDPKFYLKNN